MKRMAAVFLAIWLFNGHIRIFAAPVSAEPQIISVKDMQGIELFSEIMFRIKYFYYQDVDSFDCLKKIFTLTAI